MSEVNRVRDQLRAAAWQLAAILNRGDAARFLKEMAEEISGEDWKQGGRGR